MERAPPRRTVRAGRRLRSRESGQDGRDRRATNDSRDEGGEDDRLVQVEWDEDSGDQDGREKRGLERGPVGIKCANWTGERSRRAALGNERVLMQGELAGDDDRQQQHGSNAETGTRHDRTMIRLP
jgi:hypothetical protein